MNRVVLFTMLLVAAPTATAFYDGQEFVGVFTDGQDGVGFHDVRSVAVAEGGDDHVIFRIGVTDAGVVSPAGGYNTVFFDSPKDGWVAPGCTDKAGPTYFGNAAKVIPLACAIQGNNIYFLLSYAQLGAVVGDVLPAMQGVAYYFTPTGSAVADAGGPGPAGLVDSAYAVKYTLVGCTRADGCVAAEPEPDVDLPKTFYANLTGASFSIQQGFSVATNDTYVYNWTAADTPMNLTHGFHVQGGSVEVHAMHESGTEIFRIAGDDGNTTVRLDPAAGNWTVTFAFSEFVGTADVRISPLQESSSGSPTSTGTSTTGSSTNATSPGTTGNETADGDGERVEESPGVPFLGLIAALALVGLVRRRL